MCEMGMLPNIVAHSFQVCRVAIFLVDHLEKHRTKLDRELVQTSALLHDITKTRSLITGEFHALTGAKFINEMGYPEVAYIIGHHVILEENSASDRPTEVEVLIADPSKANKNLGWKPSIKFHDLVRIMVDADMKASGLKPIGEGEKIIEKKFSSRWWKND